MRARRLMRGILSVMWAVGTMVGSFWLDYIESRAGWGIMAGGLGMVGLLRLCCCRCGVEVLVG